MAHTVIPRRRADDSAAHQKKGSTITLHAHGDGTYHTTPNAWSDGDGRVDHASIGHALMYIASQHSDGDHHHVHSHDTGYTTHHVMEGGKVQGPQEHKTLGSVKKSLTVLDGDGDADHDGAD